MISPPTVTSRYRPLLHLDEGTFATPEQAALLEEAAGLEPVREGRWRRWERLTDVWHMLEAKVEAKPNWVRTLGMGDLWLLGEQLGLGDMVAAVREHLTAEMADGNLPQAGFRVTSIAAGGADPGVGLWYTCTGPGEVEDDRKVVGEAAWSYIDPHRYQPTHYRAADDEDGDDVDTLPLYENITRSGREIIDRQRDVAG